jgi:hypothetical protein
MAGYRKQFFDQCLVAIVTELGTVEEQHPNWPDDPVHASTMVAEKAGELLNASLEFSCGSIQDSKRILREATQTGAMALRFLLSMGDTQS